MTTFSQLVDNVIAEVRRPDLLVAAASYLNQTLREVHFTPKENNVILYRENFHELLLTANTDMNFGWDIPDSTTFQALQLVKYFGGCTPYPPEVTPSRRLQDLDAFYYRAGGRYNFSGFGGQNSQIGIGYFAYTPRLRYYAMADRVAMHDELGWAYRSGTVDFAAAQALTSNWLLLRWEDVIAEGVRAKLYKRVNDTDRARTCYSLYLSLRQGLFTSESADLGGYA